MFEPYRKFKTCIFCGGSDLTREHIFGKALAQHFPNLPHFAVALDPHQSARVGTHILKGSGPILDVAPRLACSKCNHGPLSATVDEALAPLLDLIHARRHRVDRERREKLARYWSRVGAIVDVCTSNHELTERAKARREHRVSEVHRISPPILTHEERASWLAGQPFRNLYIFIGHHKGVLGLNPAVNIAPVMKFIDGKFVTTSKYFVIALGSLAVLVIIGERLSAKEPSSSFLEISRPRGDFQWPPTRLVTYDEFFSLFSQQDLRIRVHRAIMRDGGLRRRVEQFSRKVGSFSIPPEIVEEYTRRHDRTA